MHSPTRAFPSLPRGGARGGVPNFPSKQTLNSVNGREYLPRAFPSLPRGGARGGVPNSPSQQMLNSVNKTKTIARKLKQTAANGNRIQKISYICTRNKWPTYACNNTLSARVMASPNVSNEMTLRFCCCFLHAGRKQGNTARPPGTMPGQGEGSTHDALSPQSSNSKPCLTRP